MFARSGMSLETDHISVQPDEVLRAAIVLKPEVLIPRQTEDSMEMNTTVVAAGPAVVAELPVARPEYESMTVPELRLQLEKVGLSSKGK